MTAERLRAAGPFLPAGITIAGWLLWAHFEGGYFPQAWYPSALAAVGLLGATMVGTGRFLPAGREARIALAGLIGLTLWAFLSLIWSAAPGAGWDVANKLLLYTAVAWTVALLPWRSEPARVALGLWVVGVVVVCAISLIGAAGAGPLGDYFIKGRYLDPIGYSNGVSALPMLAFFPALWLCSRREAGLPARAGFLAAAVFLAGFALVPQSRGAVIGFLAALLVFVAIVPDRLRLIPPLSVLAVAVVLSVGPIYDVYTVGIELSNATEAGEAIPGLSLRDAVRAAADAIVLATIFAAVAGLALGLMERRVRFREEDVRRVRVGVGATIVAILVVALLGAALNAGRISDEVGDRWQTFKSSDDTPAVTGARLTATYSDQRYDYWRVAFDQFKRTPVAGAGAGSYERVYSQNRDFDKPSKYTHDVWLRFLAEGGLVAIALLGLFLAACGAGLAATWRRFGTQERGIVAACAALLVYFFAHASFDWLDEFPALAAPALALPLLGSVLGREPRMRSSGRIGRASSYALAAAAVAAGLACLVSLGLPYLAERHLDRGSAIGLSNVAAAREELDRAASLNPLSPEPLLREATILVAAGRPDAARREFREAIEVEDNWYGRLELALLEAEAGRRAAAITEIRRAAALDRHDPFIAEAIGKIRSGAKISAARFNSNIRRFQAERFTRPKS